MITTLPPLSWFEDPNLDTLTPLTVTDDGRVYGHICGWGVRHRGLNGFVTPPRSKSNYAHFLLHAARVVDEGRIRTVAVGNLTMGTNHAAMNLDLRQATDHYDRADTAVAQVAVGEDAHGVWFSGAVLPDVDELRLRRFMSCGLSGDWRAAPDSGGLDLCAVLSCPVPGFPIPRARVASGAPLALVAAGALAPAVASFAKRVDPTWTASFAAAPQRVVGLQRAVTPADLAEQIAESLHRRQQDDALASEHSTLLAELDDTPSEFAALLSEVDDSQERGAALLAELSGGEGGNLTAGDVDPKAS